MKKPPVPTERAAAMRGMTAATGPGAYRPRRRFRALMASGSFCAAAFSYQ